MNMLGLSFFFFLELLDSSMKQTFLVPTRDKDIKLKELY